MKFICIRENSSPVYEHPSGNSTARISALLMHAKLYHVKKRSDLPANLHKQKSSYFNCKFRTREKDFPSLIMQSVLQIQRVD